ncbi:hypothetical protein PVAG01_03850 [Phlyctema vagabunda]|uniref:Uncharacterized protein n=1 Tax=Phlyctema vagabunda TaxID=108571 RepID=A0ABR4PML0_9HELO
MRFSTIAATLLTAVPLAAADFHFGIVDYIVTTATNRYAVILPASQTSCLDAYDFYPHGPGGFGNITAGFITLAICGKEIVLEPSTGEWYTHAREIESGTCDFINGTSGIRTESCKTAPFQSAATYLDLLSCTSDICLEEL